MLSLAFLREHPLRLLLTSLATVAATAMVVWVVSGYDALLDSFEVYSDQSQGRYTLSIAPISTFRQSAPGAIPSTAEKFVPPEVVAQLRADPAVAAADPVWAKRIAARPAEERPAGPAPEARPAPDADRGRPPAAAAARPMPRRMPDVRLLGTTATFPPYPLAAGRWIDPARPDLPEGALSADVARQLGVATGDKLIVGRGAQELRVRVVGLVQNPVADGFGAGVAIGQVMTPALGGLYVPLALAERLHGEPARFHFVGVLVAAGIDVNRFRYAWTPRLGRFATPVQFQEAHDIEENLDQSAAAENVRTQAYTSTGIALLAALFLIFSTLNMGVAERIRQFAILRAVAFSRLQIGTLIAIESFVLGTVGFGGGLGAGYVAVQIAARSADRLFRGGATLGAHCVWLAAACAYGGALLAALVPAWRATRVRPLDAMAPRAALPARKLSWPALAAGLLLMAVLPLVVFAIPMPEAARYAVYVGIGCPALGLAFVLVAPAAVVLVDRFASPLLARLLRLPPKLLASQITAHLWRTAGIALALTVGLGLYVAIQVWGYSMLHSFMPGAWAPDALVALPPPGLAPADAAGLAQLPGVDPQRCLPLVFEQPRLRDDLTRSAERATVTRQDTVVVVGLDPHRAFGGETPLFRFEWVAGTPETAMPLLASGRGCIVPDHFLRETGLRLGDAFELVPPENPAQPVRYVVAGAVRLPGWHWQTKPVGFRSRTHRAAALIFAGYADVAADFERPAAAHVWLDYAAPDVDPERLGEAVRAYCAGRPGGGDVSAARVMPIAGIRGMVRAHAKQWLWAMSRLPLVTLAITCIGVLNAMIASVRARRWDVGVLRAIGFTRWTIVRIVVAEGLLIGLVACLLSLGFGVLAGWCGAGLSQYVSFFAGLEPDLILEWGPIAGGLGAALLLCALAAVGPAIACGRTQPLALLQQGRGTF